MSSRRLKKVSSSIQDILSRLIQSQLSDPRIQGMVSITRVEPSPDLRHAQVYISILGVEERQQKQSLEGIRHAGGFLRSRLASELSMKTCPRLNFVLDDSIKKELEILQLIKHLSEEARQDEMASPPSEDFNDIGSEHEK